MVLLAAACSGSSAEQGTPTAGVTTVAGASTSTAIVDAAGASSTEATTTTVVIPTTAVASPTVTLPDDWGAFDRSLTLALVGRGAWSISVAVAKDGQIVHTAAMGVADPGKNPDADPMKAKWTAETSDRYRLGSNSKVLTAITVMKLVEEGKLALDEPATPRIAKRLKLEITQPGIAAITVRELLSHTSGFGEYDRTFFGSRVDSCEEAAARGLTNELENPPGTKFLYSNMNYCILGLLVEDATGKGYEDVVDTELLHPLGIDDMRMAGTLEVKKGDAHHLSGEARNYMEVLQAAGAWVGTASDLVRILDSLDVARSGEHPLSQATVEMMLAHPAVPYPFTGRWYGLGMRVWANGSWGHTGTVENAKSMVLHRPDGITWAVMVNGNAPKDTDDLADLVDEAFATIGITS